MKKVILVVFVALILGVTLPFWMKQKNKRQDAITHDKVLFTNRHKDFLTNLESRDTINEPEYSKRKLTTSQLYEDTKATPQVIWGKVLPAEGQTLVHPMRMRLEYHGYHLPISVVDDKMRFCFPKVKPGIYHIVLFDTSNHPGMRLKNVVVAEGQPLAETVLQVPDASVEVTVVDKKGNPVKDAQVYVAKNGSGTDPDLSAWRKGLTDSSGKFTAHNLTDGECVLHVSTLDKNGVSIINLVSNETIKVKQALTHNNW